MKIDGWQIPLATFAFIAGASAYCSHPAASSEAVAAWVQAVGSIGAILSAVWVAHRQYTQTRQLELEHAKAADDKDAAETRAFVLAVHEELTSLWEGYCIGARQMLLATPEGAPCNFRFPVTSDAFTVYNNASAMVGRVTNPELRRAIIVAYARAKGMVYTYQLNNDLVSDFDNFETLYRGEDRQARLQQKLQRLIEYGYQVKLHDAMVAHHYEELMRLTQAL
ncbi:hypothetical protein [Paraburkholderia sp. DHOC27]|uniref:hypothetical protein n=1 Tax=Paraburkholderia sp. DHOC27 TaxID=2303330 RepID=UPI000E3CFCAF|nr:hypothetical protein [Paraburkholderia sp. DHOC27]RFU46975.1 hypothetical protein D0B32_12440 [Paraburkholderia sp. DHOC27]